MLLRLQALLNKPDISVKPTAQRGLEAIAGLPAAINTKPLIFQIILTTLIQLRNKRKQFSRRFLQVTDFL